MGFNEIDRTINFLKDTINKIKDDGNYDEYKKYLHTISISKNNAWQS